MSTTNGTIKLPVGQAIEALRVLQKLAGANFPALDAYRIGRMMARMEMHPDIVAADRSRVDLIRKHGVEKDGNVSVPSEKMEDFARDYGPIAVTGVELELHRLPLEILANAPQMTPIDMKTLEPFLKEEE